MRRASGRTSARSRARRSRRCTRHEQRDPRAWRGRKVGWRSWFGSPGAKVGVEPSASPIAKRSPAGNDRVTGSRSPSEPATLAARRVERPPEEGGVFAPRSRDPTRCCRRGATGRPCRSARRSGEPVGGTPGPRSATATTRSVDARRQRDLDGRPAAHARGRCRAGCRGSARADAGPVR